MYGRRPRPSWTAFIATIWFVNWKSSTFKFPLQHDYILIFTTKIEHEVFWIKIRLDTYLNRVIADSHTVQFWKIYFATKFGAGYRHLDLLLEISKSSKNCSDVIHLGRRFVLHADAHASLPPRHRQCKPQWFRFVFVSKRFQSIRAFFEVIGGLARGYMVPQKCSFVLF